MSQGSALIAFHGKPDIKAQCIASLGADVSASQQNLDACRNSDELGIPKWLFCFAEWVERWSDTWSRDFLQAVPVGSDLDAIKGPFLVFVLGCARGVVEADHTDVFYAMKRSIALWKRSDIASDDRLNEAREAEVWASAARTRPSWRAGLAAAEGAKAAERADAVVRVVDNAWGAAVRAAKAAMAADRTRGPLPPPYDYRSFSDELLRLMKTSREGRPLSPSPARRS